jgi:hypothetical protein
MADKERGSATKLGFLIRETGPSIDNRILVSPNGQGIFFTSSLMVWKNNWIVLD